jgi:hypothetical protein
MKQIKKIVEQAKLALDKLNNGKTYPTSYVVGRLEKSVANNPGDALIGYMRDVFSKRASNQSFVSQKEITEAYDSLYGMSGGRSSFRNELEDLLMSKQAAEPQERTGTASRIPYEKSLEPLYAPSDLSEELGGAFSLNDKASFAALSNNTLRRAEKFAKLQLTALDYTPSEVTAIRSNEHFVLCNASVSTSDFTQVNIPIPVQVTNGMPTLPTSFVQGDTLVKLNKENLFVFVKDQRNFTKKASRGKYEAQRAFGELRVESPAMPSALEKFANLDNELVAAATLFSRDQVNNAINVVSAELSSLGLNRTQIKLASANDKTLNFLVSIPSAGGQVSAEIPVDMPNGMPVIPSHLSVASKVYRLNEAGLKSLLAYAAETPSINKVSRETEEMGRMTYAQLVDQIDAGVASSNFKQAEAALDVIGSKFGSTKYLASLDRFSKLLKHSSGNAERDDLIKAAVDRGDLISVSTSVQLYCPKLGLPLSKVAFDEKGRVIPKTRVAQTLDSNSGALISTSKITLT